MAMREALLCPMLLLICTYPRQGSLKPCGYFSLAANADFWNKRLGVARGINVQSRARWGCGGGVGEAPMLIVEFEVPGTELSLELVE